MIIDNLSTLLSCFSLVVVESLSHVRLFMVPWTAARQAPLCSTIPEFVQVHVS